MEKITGKTLIEWGIKPSSHFMAALEAANHAASHGLDPYAAALECVLPARHTWKKPEIKKLTRDELDDMIES